MTIDLYTSTGTKSGSVELPDALFGAPIRQGLMHLALIRQQSNRRYSIAHAKSRGEVVGSTKKISPQKGTGRARRGPLRSPIMRGGGKAFGPKSNANFTKNMPHEMRRAALLSCLSWQAKRGGVIALENYPDTPKTKDFTSMLKKMPVELGRKIVVVLPGHHRGIELSARNIPGVKTLMAQYLNPEDILGARTLLFLVDAIKVAEKTFGERKQRNQKNQKNEKSDAVPQKNIEASAPKVKKTTAAKKKAPKKSSGSSGSSSSSGSSK